MWKGGVRVIIADEDNKILMLRQTHDDTDIWMVPGGAIEEGENSVDAAVREVREETGLEIDITGMAWRIEEVSPERGQRFVNYMFGRVTGGELKLGMDPELDEDAQVIRELAFMNKEEIGNLQNVYPSFFNDEVWAMLEQKNTGMKFYRLKEPWVTTRCR